MAKCEKCGTSYLTRECLDCRDKEYSRVLSENNQIDRSKNNRTRKKQNVNTDYSNKKHANFSIRLMASLIDTMVIGVPVTLLISTGLAEAFIAIITITLWVVWSGQSIGKKLLNIKIVDDNYNEIGIGKAVIRYIGYIVSTITMFLGYAIVPFRKDKKALHDLMASTYVIHTDKENTNIESDTVDKFLAIISVGTGTALIVIMISTYYVEQESSKMLKQYNAQTQKAMIDITQINNDMLKNISRIGK